MRDHFSEHCEWVNGIPRRKKRVARDGERFVFLTMTLDHSAFCPFFADGSPDPTSPHKRGFRFLDVDDPAKLAADAAYEQMRERLSSAWRKDKDRRDPICDARRPTLDELETAASAAYEARSERMRNAWKR
jgi:hypothetical protein